jgi:oligopeptide/dipeptide ABC transporter ATP-binding protein
MPETILEVKNLVTNFHTEEGVVRAVSNLSFTLEQGETLAIVGESGCGKSVTALSILRLVPSPPGKIENGEILYKGEDLLKKSEKEIRKLRGNEISMIFQEPMTSLNPVFTVGRQISESLHYHQGMGKAAARQKAIEMLELVGIPTPEKVVDDYPHQLSGGMRQRVMIAMALACNPKILIADEPTTALDVTIQAQILRLLKNLKQRIGSSIILITHDLGIVAQIADKVMVMYAGESVESCEMRTLYEIPRHPYTMGLIQSVPKLNETVSALHTIPGMVPSLADCPVGCRFAPRCERAFDRCECEHPDLFNTGGGHFVRCFLYAEGGAADA